LRQLCRCHSDRIQDVGDSRREKLLGFLQRRNGDAARAGVELGAHDRQTLRRLDVRTEARAERMHPLLHAVDVLPHASHVYERRGRTEIRDGRHATAS
jgi:hypothetical protein